MLLLLFFPAPLLSAQDNLLAESYQRIRRSIVGIEVDATNANKKNFIFKGRFYGTGFAVAKNLVLTTQEVVQDQLTARCIFYHHQAKMAKVVAYDNHTPLVLLEVELPAEVVPIPLQTTVKIGEIALVIGNPYKSISRVYQIACSFGIVSGRYDLSRGSFVFKDVIETDAAVNPGNFGGPLVNIHGEAIGVLFSGYAASRLCGVAIAPEQIDEFLQRFREGKIPIPDEIFLLQSFPVFLGLSLEKKRGKLIVSFVEPDSPAQDAKILQGDILLAIGKQPVTSPEHFRSLLQQYFVGQKIKLVVQRRKRILEILVVLRSRFM